MPQIDETLTIEPDRFVRMVEKLHDHGIALQGCFVFGLDADDRDVFMKTAEFAVSAPVPPELEHPAAAASAITAAAGTSRRLARAAPSLVLTLLRSAWPLTAPSGHRR